MGEVNTVGLDLAKSVFQVHGADDKGAVVVRKKLRRDRLTANWGVGESRRIKSKVWRDGQRRGRENQ
jgi:hypothetical protein